MPKLFIAFKIFVQKKPVQLARIGLIRFSWNYLSAPQADVKSALKRSFRVLCNPVNEFGWHFAQPKCHSLLLSNIRAAKTCHFKLEAYTLVVFKLVNLNDPFILQNHQKPLAIANKNDYHSYKSLRRAP
jgi:hypothetical protein